MKFSRFTACALALLFVPAIASGQRTSFGVVGGTNLTRDFPLLRQAFAPATNPQGATAFDHFSDTHSFVAGLSVTVDFGNRMSLHASALHRNLRSRTRFVWPDGSSVPASDFVVTTWEWPVLLRCYTQSTRTVRPYIEAGPSFRTRHNPAPVEPSQIGGSVGAGIELRWGQLRVSPLVRYTRWRYDGDFPRFATKRDQIEIATGISYATSVPSWNVGGRKLWFGLIAGTPFTGGLDQRYSDGSGELQGYLGGLAAEIELSRTVSIEINGLYRPLRGDEAEFTVLTWQVPVLMNFRFGRASLVRPVLEAGPSLRFSGNLSGYNPSRLGFTGGFGVETRYRALKAGAMLRYTRWARDSVNTGLLPGPRTAPNQAELLLSFTF